MAGPLEGIFHDQHDSLGEFDHADERRPPLHCTSRQGAGGIEEGQSVTVDLELMT